MVETGSGPAIEGIHQYQLLVFDPFFARIRLFGPQVPKSLLIYLEISHKATESGRFGQDTNAGRRTKDATCRVVKARWSN